MANRGPSTAFLLVGGRDITSDTFMLTETVEHITEETHSLGDSWAETLPVGIARVLLEASGGLYDNTQNRIVTALQAKGETRQLVSWGFDGFTTGAEAVMIDGTYSATWKRIAERNGLTKAHALHKISGTYYTGKILHGTSSETASSGDTISPSVDNGAATTGGATADLHIPLFTAGGGLGHIEKVLHSADDVTYATLITFTSSTGVTSERKTATGSVDRHLAMNWAITASTSGAVSGSEIKPYVVVTRL